MKEAIKWRTFEDFPSLNAVKPYIGTIALIFSQIDGFGVAEFSEGIGLKGRWVWLYKSVNGSQIAKGVTHWAELELPTSE